MCNTGVNYMMKVWDFKSHVNKIYMYIYCICCGSPLSYILRVLRSGYLRPIADHRKQYLPIRSPIPIFLKPSFYHVELLIVMIQSRFFDIYSKPEFYFWKWIPLLGDSCERGFFNLRGGGGHFLDIFQKYIFISPKCLIMHYICCTIAYTLHKPDFMSCMWDGLLHQVHTYSVCSPYVWYVSGAEAALTVLSHRSPLLIHGCLPQTHLSIILISNPNIVTENAFSALWFFFYTVE